MERGMIAPDIEHDPADGRKSLFDNLEPGRLFLGAGRWRRILVGWRVVARARCLFRRQVVFLDVELHAFLGFPRINRLDAGNRDGNLPGYTTETSLELDPIVAHDQ